MFCENIELKCFSLWQWCQNGTLEILRDKVWVSLKVDVDARVDRDVMILPAVRWRV